MPPVINWFMVALGGASGACARYGLSYVLSGHAGRLPLGTLLANLIGCLLAGFLTTLYLQRGFAPGTTTQLLLVTGFLGGFTTFSAFSVETLRLAESGEIATAGVNVALNLIGALLAVLLGAWLARLV